MLKELRTTSFKTRVPYQGPLSSEQYNHIIGLLVGDINSIADDWNSTLKDLINTLPGGDEVGELLSSSPDAFQNGLDGNNIYVDNRSTLNTDNGLFYKETRPASIKEAIISLYLKINTESTSLRNQIKDIVNSTSGLTPEQKKRLGASIFNPTEVSSSVSLDGRVAGLESIAHLHLYNIGINTGSSLSYFLRVDSGSGTPGTILATQTAAQNGSDGIYLWNVQNQKITFLPYSIVLKGYDTTLTAPTNFYNIRRVDGVPAAYEFAFDPDATNYITVFTDANIEDLSADIILEG